MPSSSETFKKQVIVEVQALFDDLFKNLRASNRRKSSSIISMDKLILNNYFLPIIQSLNDIKDKKKGAQVINTEALITEITEQLARIIGLEEDEIKTEITILVKILKECERLLELDLNALDSRSFQPAFEIGDNINAEKHSLNSQSQVHLVRHISKLNLNPAIAVVQKETQLKEIAKEKREDLQEALGDIHQGYRKDKHPANRGFKKFFSRQRTSRVFMVAFLHATISSYTDLSDPDNVKYIFAALLVVKAALRAEDEADKFGSESTLEAIVDGLLSQAIFNESLGPKSKKAAVDALKTKLDNDTSYALSGIRKWNAKAETESLSEKSGAKIHEITKPVAAR